MTAGPSFITLGATAATVGANVRSLTGYTATRDCPDADLTAIIAKAQVLVLHDIARRVAGITMWGIIDGTNTRFELPPRFQGRVFLDADLNGTEVNEIQCHLRSVPSTAGVPASWVAATVSSVDVLHGQVVLSAAPSTTLYDRVSIQAWVVGASITTEQFTTCVELLSAHLLDQRVRGPGNVVLSNPNAQNKDNVKPGQDWLSLYKDAVKNLRGLIPLASTSKVSFPGVYLPGRTEAGGELPYW